MGLNPFEGPRSPHFPDAEFTARRLGLPKTYRDERSGPDPLSSSDSGPSPTEDVGAERVASRLLQASKRPTPPQPEHSLPKHTVELNHPRANPSTAGFPCSKRGVFSTRSKQAEGESF